MEYLSFDCIVNIYSYLPPEDILSCCEVCKSLREIGASHEVWKELCSRFGFIDKSLFFCSCYSDTDSNGDVCGLKKKFLKFLRVKRNIKRLQYRKFHEEVGFSDVSASDCDGKRLVVAGKLQSHTYLMLWELNFGSPLLIFAKRNETILRTVKIAGDILVTKTCSNTFLRVKTYKIEPCDFVEEEEDHVDRVALTMIYNLDFPKPATLDERSISSEWLTSMVGDNYDLEVYKLNTGEKVGVMDLQATNTVRHRVESWMFVGSSFYWLGAAIQDKGLVVKSGDVPSMALRWSTCLNYKRHRSHHFYLWSDKSSAYIIVIGPEHLFLLSCSKGEVMARVGLSKARDMTVEVYSAITKAASSWLEQLRILLKECRADDPCITFHAVKIHALGVAVAWNRVCPKEDSTAYFSVTEPCCCGRDIIGHYLCRPSTTRGAYLLTLNHFIAVTDNVCVWSFDVRAENNKDNMI